MYMQAACVDLAAAAGKVASLVARSLCSGDIKNHATKNVSLSPARWWVRNGANLKHKWVGRSEQTGMRWQGIGGGRKDSSCDGIARMILACMPMLWLKPCSET